MAVAAASTQTYMLLGKFASVFLVHTFTAHFVANFTDELQVPGVVRQASNGVLLKASRVCLSASKVS